ncbi:MAG: F0F1 ATP synthase subunit delta [Treponema sp.]|jgi:F0F1-type ATP synthase delta subunit|nr:F0F1 ATP synthase subunit delta [Treponema sp.]
MFHPDRWALAFTAACGEDVENGFAALTVLFACLNRLPVKELCSSVSGEYPARQLEEMMRRAAGTSPRQGGLETAIRFILLLVKKGCFRQAGRVIAEIENLLDRKKGVVRAVVEAAVPPDPAFEADLKAALCKKHMEHSSAEHGSTEHSSAVSGVTVEIRVRPELLGGYRLIIGGRVWDASLREQIRNMAQALGADLEAVSRAGVFDGGFA